MKIVLFSGAGLSAPSGLPTYDEIKSDPRYSSFFSRDDANARAIATTLRDEFIKFKPNTAHRECVKFQKFCESIGVEFSHYTLNIDNLIEEFGGNVIHVYGCINDIDSIVNNRFFPAVNIDNLIWEAGDILIIIGMSDNGYPIAYLENLVMSAGGSVHHFNLTKRDDLIGEQITGNLANTLSALSLSLLIPIEFEALDIGAYEAHLKRFSIGGRSYEVFFSPSLEFYTAAHEIDLIQAHTGHALDGSTYEVKFDLESNRLTKKSFARPTDNMAVSELKLLGIVIARVMCSHAELVGGKLYTASAAYPKLVPFYNRLAREYESKLNCVCWCAFGPKGVSYAFKI